MKSDARKIGKKRDVNMIEGNEGEKERQRKGKREKRRKKKREGRYGKSTVLY